MSNYQPPSMETETPDQGSSLGQTTEQHTSNLPGLGMQNGNPAQNNTAATKNKGPQPAQNPAPGAAQTPAAIDIKFERNSDDAGSLAFKMKPTTAFKKAIDAYCQKTGSDRKVLRFLFDGERVQDEDTPAKLEMVDGDMIEVHMEQIGGCWWGFGKYAGVSEE